VDGLVIGDDPFFVAQQKQLVALASRYLIPTTYISFVSSPRPAAWSIMDRASRLQAAGWRLCLNYNQGRQASGLAGSASNQVRAGHQSQNREGARPRSAGNAARAHRRGDRIAMPLIRIIRTITARTEVTNDLRRLRSPENSELTPNRC